MNRQQKIDDTVAYMQRVFTEEYLPRDFQESVGKSFITVRDQGRVPAVRIVRSPEQVACAVGRSDGPDGLIALRERGLKCLRLNP